MQITKKERLTLEEEISDLRSIPDALSMLLDKRFKAVMDCGTATALDSPDSQSFSQLTLLITIPNGFGYCGFSESDPSSQTPPPPMKDNPIYLGDAGTLPEDLNFL